MRVSTRGGYALRLMADVALHRGTGCVPLKEVAARQGLSMKYLEQIAGILEKGGFPRSGRGAQGGCRLPRDPAEYTVSSVLRLTEGGFGTGDLPGAGTEQSLWPQ